MELPSGLKLVPMGAGLGPAEIADGERRIALRIPERYRVFLAHMNGARLGRCVFFAPKAGVTAARIFDVAVLAGIRPSGSGVDPGDLASWHACFGKSNIGPPPGAFQFASSPDGDFVVFAEGPSAGEVHYVDREERKRTRVATSMDAFFAGLRARDAADVVAVFPIEKTIYVSALKPRRKKKLGKRLSPTGNGIRVFENETFRGSVPRRAAIARDVRAVDCVFSNCAPAGSRFSTFERIELNDAVCRTRHLSRTILRDVLVDGATIRVKPNASNVVSLVNCLFERVVLAGDIRGGVFVRRELFGLSAADKRLMRSFYDDVDWALDLRKARFSNLTLRGVPGHLVLRDPERQVLIRSDRLAADPTWRKWEKGFVAILEHALDCADDWHFHSADDLAPKAAVRRAQVKRLRDSGFGE